MPPVSNIPKWFWIALGLIVLATIISISYCNSKSKQVASEVAGSLSQTQIDEIKAQVKQDVFDLIPDLQAALNK